MARLVPALARGMDVLELFLRDEELSAPEIGKALGLPRTTVHELLSTLVARGYLNADRAGAVRYRLGLRPFELGQRYRHGLDLVELAHRAATALVERCAETTQAAVLDRADVVYIARVDSPRPVRLVSTTGSRLPAHCTGCGKILLAALGTAELDAVCPPDVPLIALTPHSVTDPGKLRAELAEVRRTGVAFDTCESNLEVSCVAAPVYDHGGGVVAALSVSVPMTRWTAARRRELTDQVAATAADLSGRLGARAVRPH